MTAEKSRPWPGAAGANGDADKNSLTANRQAAGSLGGLAAGTAMKGRTDRMGPLDGRVGAA